MDNFGMVYDSYLLLQITNLRNSFHNVCVYTKVDVSDYSIGLTLEPVDLVLKVQV